jgi:coenzyme F420-reducing hydrogenase delta subunit/NAD-dependent dihydropyrimidine dehydrogenase PreA subunit
MPDDAASLPPIAPAPSLGALLRGGPPLAEPPPAAVPEEEVRGADLLRRLERGFLLLDRALGKLVPDALNPFLHTGAVAITNLAVATVTGVVLLLWYSPSVHQAYASVEAMTASPLGAGLLRSLHRYSSDACMFFAFVHALRLFFERRFTGARWVAWITGLAAVATLWFVGWTGYWLVWDARGQHVAMGTARLLDVVPIFADPMGRSFLTDAGVNSLLFFVVFFFHMLAPLALVVALWLHLVRLSRARFVTGRPLTIWVLGSLLLLSAVYPATSAAPARMTALGDAFTMDWWYLLPLVLSDRLGGGALWSVLLAGGIALGSVPWALRRGRRPAARVDPILCNACEQCFQDCPFEAIAMVPRTAGRTRYALQAEVDPAKCVGCGICAGSCDSVGVGLEHFAVPDQRARIEAWIEEAVAQGETPYLALVCATSAGAGLSVDARSGRCAELPGYRVLEIPCAGWIHMLTIERALRRGADGVLVVACPRGACHYREGALWTEQRLAGERAPSLRLDKIDPARVRLLELGATERAALLREARAFCDAGGAAPHARLARVSALRGWLGAAVLAALVAGGVGLASDLGYSAPRPEGSELVVTFKHPGQTSERCRDVTPEEQAKLPPHMRRDRICDRHRPDVRLRVSVDGAVVRESSHPPSGIWGDGNSIAVERIPVSPGAHRVRVEIGDAPEPDVFGFVADDTLEFTRDARRVVAFDRLAGFTWH